MVRALIHAVLLALSVCSPDSSSAVAGRDVLNLEDCDEVFQIRSVASVGNWGPARGQLGGGHPRDIPRAVTRPAMTAYSPEGINTGAAAVVFPGGGAQGLAIDLEGTEVWDWLKRNGITCVLPKYRVMEVGPDQKSGPYPVTPRRLKTRRASGSLG